MNFRSLALISFWLVLCVLGFLALFRYGKIDGSKANNPEKYPQESRIEFQEDKYNLLFFAHPKCPCTLASYEELQKLLLYIQAPYSLTMVFTVPKDMQKDFAENSKLYQASQNFTRFVDLDEIETNLFACKTSGHLLIYNPDQNLIYSGGLTGSRAHAGDNLFRDRALESIIKNLSLTGEVFGCPLSQ